LAAHVSSTPRAFIATARSGKGWHGLCEEPELRAALERTFEDHEVWINCPDASMAVDRSLDCLVVGSGFVANWPVNSKAGKRIAYLVVLDQVARGPLSQDQVKAVEDVVAQIADTLSRDCLQRELAGVGERAARAEMMLRLVVDARSCEEALTRMLSTLCEYHDVTVGRIWRLAPDETLHEVSRFVDSRQSAEIYAGLELKQPARVGNSHIAASIHANQPQALHYSGLADTGQYVRLSMAIAAGLRCQISYPIWVQEQRFGVTMVFARDRDDLEEIIADIASLENTIRPILFRKVTEERIWFMAHHDELTQLANRAVFKERLAEEVAAAAARSDGHGLAVLYLDLDGFKLVNDMRGHAGGDKLLAAVAGRLRANIRELDVLARIGGDEFAIIHPSSGQPYAAMQFARRLLKAFAAPFDIEGQPTVVGLSLGIALYPLDGTTPDELERHADAALYAAKQGGRNTLRLFSPKLAVLQQERQLVERDLKDAVERQEFTLDYQPIMQLDDYGGPGTEAGMAVHGLEALLRWTHAIQGPVPPERFIPVAEATGLIVPLGRWVLEAACRAAASWKKPLSVSVNLSPLQFRQAGLARSIESMLTRTGLAPARLDLEVTEGLLLDESGRVMRTMGELQEMGVRMTLDDFGTAHASLSYLRRFPFDQIKIDRSFINGIGRDDATTAIVEAILSLSARLGLEVVAEGVETEEELSRLRAMGCGYVQGFLTGRPVPEAKAAELASGRLESRGISG
jgi:diguanylate cyclase (GGDEF)-like protein